MYLTTPTTFLKYYDVKKESVFYRSSEWFNVKGLLSLKIVHRFTTTITNRDLELKFEVPRIKCKIETILFNLGFPEYGNTVNHLTRKQ